MIFPLSGGIAQLEEQEDGRAAEVAVIGCDGVCGFEALFAQAEALFTWVTTVPTSAFVVDVALLRRLYEGAASLRALVARYALASIRLAAIGAACDRHHRVEVRLAQYLLQLHDHAGDAELHVTHDRLATHLGIRRAGVTQAYAELARSGAIAHERGRLTLLRPELLEAVACGCYAEAKHVLDRVYAG